MTVGKPDLFVGADGLQETSPAGLDVSNRRALDEVVTKLLGRRPQGGYDVAVARSDGTPVVLVNEPFLQTGRPMPTRYWLIDPGLNKAIGALESYGGVKQAEAAIDPAELRLAHDRYRRERDRQIGPDHRGPKPTGGVGGTRTGVKCLHAHYGYFLAGGEDPVGRWVHAWLRDRGQAPSDLVVRHRALSDDQLAVAAHEDAADGGRSVPTSESSWALVEIGSGALKLLADVGGGPLRRRFPVDLLPETDDQGRLSRRGRRRLSEGLGHIAELIGSEVPVNVVATEALRRPFSSDIAEMVRETLGAEIEVLDGLREAELGFQAVIGSTGANGPGPAPVTIGIGYGSTEFATIGADGRLLRMSLPIGASTVTEHYLAGDPPRAEELSAALSVIELYLDDLRREQPDLAAALAQGRAEVVGLGAIRFIAEVELGRNEGDEIEGYQLTCTATEEVFRALATESAGERTANPGLRPEHVDGIVGAMCVLVETMRQFGIAALRVSTAGLLDGLAAVRTVGPVGHGQTSQSGGPSGSGTVH